MSEHSLTLPPKLNLQFVDQLQSDLLEHEGRDLCLNAGDVRQITALGVQLLRAAARTWALSGHGLRISNLSGEVQAQLALLGFDQDTLLTWESA